MEKQYDLISPGTAGIAQRISSEEPSEEKEISILQYNTLMPCDHNQY